MRSKVLIVAIFLVLAISCGVWALRERGTTDPDEQLQAALAALDRGDRKPANDMLRKLRTAPNSESHVRLLRGALLARSGKTQEALAVLSSAPFEGSLLVPALATVCEALYAAGQLTTAEAVAHQLIAEQPNHSNAHRWLAAIYYDLGANNAAIAELETVASLSPGDFSPHHLLGVIYIDFEKYTDAARELRLAVERNPPPGIRDTVVRDLVKALVRTRDYDAALEFVEPQKTDDPAILALAAECHWGLGRETQARTLLQQALERDPDERTALLLSARLDMESGNLESAIAPLLRQLDRDPHDYESRYRLAQIYRRLNRIADSDEQMEKFETARKRRAELAELSDKAVDEPRNAEVRDRIADLYDLLGKPEQAELFRQAARSCRQFNGGERDRLGQ